MCATMFAVPTIAAMFPSQQADELFGSLENAFLVEQESGALFRQVAEQFQKTLASDASVGDVKKAMRRFYKAYSESSGPAERGILYQGLVGSLRKDSLESGWNLILWEKLLELQPADVEFMNRLKGAHGYLLISDDADYELAERLSKRSLAFVDVAEGTGNISVTPRGAFGKLLSFIF